MYYYYQHAHKNTTIIASFKKNVSITYAHNEPVACAHLLNMQPQYETARRHKSMRGFCQQRTINANIVNGGAAAEKVSIYI